MANLSTPSRVSRGVFDRRVRLSSSAAHPGDEDFSGLPFECSMEEWPASSDDNDVDGGVGVGGIGAAAGGGSRVGARPRRWPANSEDSATLLHLL
jgi:hypothetical protein